MKKSNTFFSGLFPKVTIKIYSKKLVSFFHKSWLYVLAFLLTSCSVQNTRNSDQFGHFSKNFSASFYDHLDTITNSYDNQTFTRSLLKDFTAIENIDYKKPIRLEIVGDKLHLKFADNTQKEFVLVFYGKRYKKKFVFYSNYETISFPFLFITKDMTKHSIFLSNTNDIIFEKHNVSEGMVLLFGASGGSKMDYKFKIITNE